MLGAIQDVLFFLVIYVLPLLVFTSAGIRLILGLYSARGKMAAAMLLALPHSVMLLGGGGPALPFGVALSIIGAVMLVLGSRGTKVWFYWIELIVGVLVIALILKAFGG